MQDAAPIKIPSPWEYLNAPSVLLMGDTGTGKTDVLGELALHVDRLFYICTEPNGLETLLDSFMRRQVPIEKLHFVVINPARAGFHDLMKLAQRLSILTYDTATKQLPGSRQGAKLIEVMGAFHSFTCQRTGKNFGSLETLTHNDAVAVDSFSGISDMAWDITVGDKLTAHQGEWGMAMNMLKRAMLTWTSNLKCLFVVTAHQERELEEVTQNTKVMVSTLGKKLAPNIPRNFSEVVQTYAEAGQFFWRTQAMGVILKHRALPMGDKLPPSFKPIVEAYKKRLELVSKPGEAGKPQ